MSNLLNKAIHKVHRRIERKLNQRCRFDYPVCANGINRLDTPVLEGPGSVFDPFVIGCEDKLSMYYSDRASGTVMVCESADGVKWSTGTVALDHSSSSLDWDAIVNRACVLEHDGEYYMWFTGQGKSGTSIGFARSADGLHFCKASDGPVVACWDFPGCEAVMNPCVLWDEQRSCFRMWFAAGEEYEPDVLYAADSPDGRNWALTDLNPVLKKGPDEYDCAKVGGCDVVALGDGHGYIMFYIGYQNVDVARVCAAWSLDGLKWARFQGNPLISPARDSWDADAVYKPAALIDKKTGTARVWYNGRSGTSEKIGLVTISASLGLLDPESYLWGRK